MSNHEQIKSAFRRLPLLDGTETLLHSAITMLADIDCQRPGTVPMKFSNVSRRQTKIELEKLADPVNDLSACYEALHQPAILALAAYGFSRGPGPLPEALREIAERASKSDLKCAPILSAGGKRKNVRAHAVATLLAYNYELLTGKKPTLRIDAMSDDKTPHGPFINLVTEVFSVLGLSVSTEDIARAAIKRRNEIIS